MRERPAFIDRGRDQWDEAAIIDKFGRRSVHQRCATDRKRNRREILLNKSQRLCATQYFRRAAFSVLFYTATEEGYPGGIHD